MDTIKKNVVTMLKSWKVDNSILLFKEEGYMKKLKKTIMFHEDIYLAIQRERAEVMINDNEDFTFTEAVNYMLEELLERRLKDKQ